jgi:hypothetical protein
MASSYAGWTRSASAGQVQNTPEVKAENNSNLASDEPIFVALFD